MYYYFKTFQKMGNTGMTQLHNTYICKDEKSYQYAKKFYADGVLNLLDEEGTCEFNNKGVLEFTQVVKFNNMDI